MRALVLVAVGCAAPSATHPAEPGAPVVRDPAFEASSQRLKATLARDGIELDTEPVLDTCDGQIRQRHCARCDVVTALDVIDPHLIDDMAIAFGRYPTSLRKAAQLEHVAFCRAIKYEDDEHNPAGLADPNAHRVYISIEYFQGEGARESIESAVHHEVFHLLDSAAFNSVEGFDDEWSKLNPKGFTYAKRSLDLPRPPGFVTTYAATNDMEDRAVTFEHLMVRPQTLCEIAATDPAVARKARLLWKRVSKLDGAKRLGVSADCLAAAPKQKPLRNPKQRATKGYRLRLER